MCLLRADRAAAAGDAGEDEATSYWPQKPERGKESPSKYVRDTFK